MYNDDKENQINTEEHWSNTSNSEDDELNTENPTTSQLDVDISEVNAPFYVVVYICFLYRNVYSFN